MNGQLSSFSKLFLGKDIIRALGFFLCRAYLLCRTTVGLERQNVQASSYLLCHSLLESLTFYLVLELISLS